MRALPSDTSLLEHVRTKGKDWLSNNDQRGQHPSWPGVLALNDVERIEILRGAAPVMYGATSFVGVIQVIHYPAGQAANQAQIGYGSFGSVHGSIRAVSR
jgi:outer membrane receptor protein involved in Fe transport